MDCKPSRFVKARFLDSLSDAGTMTDYQRCHFNYGNKEPLKIPLICINIDFTIQEYAHGKPTFSMLFNIEFTDQSAVFKQMSLSI